MGRAVPSPAQNFLSSVILPCLSVFLLPVSLLAVVGCIARDLALRQLGLRNDRKIGGVADGERKRRCVLITGGRMSKGLTLARAFKRAGWKVIGVDEAGWGELCPMRFSSAVDQFYILPPAAESYQRYSAKLLEIVRIHSVDLFIPVSGAGSSVEDAQAAEEMFDATKGSCRTFIQDPETMLDLHDKDRFMALVERLGFPTPSGKMVTSVEEAMTFLREDKKDKALEPNFVLKCMGLDENRGDMTLYPLKGDDNELSKTKAALKGLRLKITKDCPYVFQEFIPGQEWCTHASVIDGKVTSFVTCPSNDMLMTYENATTDDVGRRAEAWTVQLLNKLKKNLTPTGKTRGLTGHFSFDFIISTKNGQMYPLECNARVHTAVIMLPVSKIASYYEIDSGSGSKQRDILRPLSGTPPRSWLYNDLIMRYLPLIVPSKRVLTDIHPSLPACYVDLFERRNMSPSEAPFVWRIDPTLVADDWLPFIVLWHVWWPSLLIKRWWQGKKWNRLNVSTGRIFEA